MAEEKENFILRAGLRWSQGLWEETERKEGIISAFDKNDLGLIFKFCLEFKPPGDCSLWRRQEHRFEGMPSRPGRSSGHRAQCHAGRHVGHPGEELGLQRRFLIWTSRACVLPTDVFHCSYVALIKVANNCDHSELQLPFIAYLITVSTAGEAVHTDITVLPSSVDYHRSHLTHFTFVQTNRL